MASAAAKIPAQNPYRIPQYMFNLLMNPFVPKFLGLTPEGGGFVLYRRPAYRVVDAGLHGRMPPHDWAKQHPAHEGYMPVVTVNPHIMIIMAGAEKYMGHEATICDLAHKIVLPAIGPGAVAPPHIVNLFGELLGVKELPFAHHLYYAAPGERIGNRILELKPDSRFHKKGSVLEDRGSLFGLKEITAYGYTVGPVLNTLEEIIDTKYSNIINVGILQTLITEYMKPTKQNPIIVYINACDVSLKTNADADPAYIKQMRRSSHWSYPSPIKWPKMPLKSRNWRLAVRPAASHRGVFRQNSDTIELRQASTTARSQLEIPGILEEAPSTMLQVIHEEVKENNSGATGGAAPKKRKRNKTCKKNNNECPNSKSPRKKGSKKASPS